MASAKCKGVRDHRLRTRRLSHFVLCTGCAAPQGGLRALSLNSLNPPTPYASCQAAFLYSLTDRFMPFIGRMVAVGGTGVDCRLGLRVRA